MQIALAQRQRNLNQGYLQTLRRPLERAVILFMVTQNCDSVDYPMLVYPKLASILGGSDEAIFVAQVHYWTVKSGHFRPEDGQRWIWNSIDDWLKQFAWISYSTLKRIVRKLEKLGILLTDKVQKRAWNQTKWYRIDYAKLVENGWNPCNLALGQNDPIVSFFKKLTIGSKWSDRSAQNGLIDQPKMTQSSLDPETSSENTSKKEEAFLKNFEEEQEEEGICQPLATLKVKPEPAGEELKISGEDQSSATAPTEIKAVLGALFSGSSDDRSRQRERPRAIPQGYFEEVSEILGKHQVALEKLGIDLGNENLQESINSHPHNLEPAIEAFLERCAKGSIEHPERYLNAAVRQGWRPRNQSSTSGSPKSPFTPEFLEAYKQLCECGFVEPLAPEHLPVVSNVINVRVRTLNPRPYDPPYQNLPWTEALSKATVAGLLPDIGDDDW